MGYEREEEGWGLMCIVTHATDPIPPQVTVGAFEIMTSNTCSALNDDNNDIVPHDPNDFPKPEAEESLVEC